MNLDRFFERAARHLRRAKVSDIELTQTRPQARRQVLDTHAALCRFMKHCGIDPQNEK